MKAAVIGALRKSFCYKMRRCFILLGCASWKRSMAKTITISRPSQIE